MPEYSAEIAAAQQCLDDFMAAFNARDLPAFEKTFNFPSVRLASNKLVILEPGYHKPEMFARGALADWDHSAWERRDVIHAGRDKVHIDTRFTRYRARRQRDRQLRLDLRRDLRERALGREGALFVRPLRNEAPGRAGWRADVRRPVPDPRRARRRDRRARRSPDVEPARSPSSCGAASASTSCRRTRSTRRRRPTGCARSTGCVDGARGRPARAEGGRAVSLRGRAALRAAQRRRARAVGEPRAARRRARARDLGRARRVRPRLRLPGPRVGSVRHVLRARHGARRRGSSTTRCGRRSTATCAQRAVELLVALARNAPGRSARLALRRGRRRARPRPGRARRRVAGRDGALRASAARARARAASLSERAARAALLRRLPRVGDPADLRRPRRRASRSSSGCARRRRTRSRRASGAVCAHVEVFAARARPDEIDARRLAITRRTIADGMITYPPLARFPEVEDAGWGALHRALRGEIDRATPRSREVQGAAESRAGGDAMSLLAMEGLVGADHRRRLGDRSRDARGDARRGRAGRGARPAAAAARDGVLPLVVRRHRPGIGRRGGGRGGRRTSAGSTCS